MLLGSATDSLSSIVSFAYRSINHLRRTSDPSSLSGKTMPLLFCSKHASRSFRHIANNN